MKLGVPNWINNQTQLDNACEKVTLAIQDTIAAEVPMTSISPKTKRWWTKELTALQRQANKLGCHAHKLKHHPSHPIHKQFNAARTLYDKTLKYTKRQHWWDWLKKAKDPDIWTVHKYLSLPACYGSRLILYFLCLHLRYLARYLLGMPASVACDHEYQLHKKDCLSRHSGSSYPTWAVPFRLRLAKHDSGSISRTLA